MKNNIKELLDIKRMSVYELAKLIEKDYPTVHALVNRNSLDTTKLDTLVQVADVLDVDIQMLYGEKTKEIRVLRLYNARYAGGLIVEALDRFKNEVEEGIKEKLGRFSVLTYEYKSDIDMTGVEDIVNLEIMIGSRKNDEDRYTFNFKTRSAELIFKNDLVNIIVLTIKEYEKGEYKTIGGTFEHLDFEGYNHSSMELVKVEEHE